MVDTKAKEKCPFCKEEIAPGAVICKHCHSILKMPSQQKKAPSWRSKFMLGFYCGLAFSGFLVYLYFRIS
jgi:predicted nucleic acid-binding Zn ribbon protein